MMRPRLPAVLTTVAPLASVVAALLSAIVALISPSNAASKSKPAASSITSLQQLPAEPAAFAKAEDLLAWMTRYRAEPEPARLPEAVKAMVKGRLTRDMDEAGIYVGFVAGVLGSSPDTAEKLIEKMFPLEPFDQVLVIKAIAYSGLPDWKAVLGKFTERMPARTVLISRYLYGNKPALETLTFKDDASALDVNWGYYYATGAEPPVRRIVAALAWSADRNDMEKLTVGAMAKWTLAQNAARDLELLRLLKAISGNVAKSERAPLLEAIEAAETLELAKVKKQALASIDELKARGPANIRNYNWWSQAGQTVLALGCVAASALGQIEFGIPCVIGGALSSAALRYLGPDGSK